MDTSPITARSLQKPYHIKGDEFERAYKDHLSDFRTWKHKSHAQKWLVFPRNIGPNLSIDETSLSNGDLYTIISNKDAHGRKGAIIAVVKGTNPADVLKVLMQLPADKREMVENITMDLLDCMRVIAREAFPKATVIRDCFHVVISFEKFFPR